MLTDGRPSVIVPVLSSTTVSIFSAVCRASMSRMRMPRRAPLPVPTMIAAGKAKAQRAWAGDDQHAAHRVGQPGPGHRRRPMMPNAKGVPPDGRHQRDRQHHRHENRGDAVGQLLHRRLGGLGRLHQPHDLRQRGLTAHAGCLDRQSSVGVDRPGHHFVADIANNRQRLAGDHRLIHGRPPRENHSIHRNPIARPNQQPIAEVHLLDGDFTGSLRIIQPQGRGRSEGHQLADRIAGRIARPGLQPMPGADQGQQAGGFHEINALGGPQNPSQCPTRAITLYP